MMLVVSSTTEEESSSGSMRVRLSDGEIAMVSEARPAALVFSNPRVSKIVGGCFRAGAVDSPDMGRGSGQRSTRRSLDESEEAISVGWVVTGEEEKRRKRRADGSPVT